MISINSRHGRWNSFPGCQEMGGRAKDIMSNILMLYPMPLMETQSKSCFTLKLGLENGDLPEFLQLVIKLMLAYIKRSAAVPATKLFKSLTFDSSKGIKHFYTSLLHVAEKMITHPDQVTFKRRTVDCSSSS